MNAAEDEKIAANPDFNTWDSLFLEFGNRYQVPFVWLKAICMNESSLGQAESVRIGLQNPADVTGSQSEDGLSWGIMQVTVKAARDFDINATPQLLNNPRYSVEMACKYLARTKKQFSIVSVRYEEYVIKSYNAGAGRVQQYIDGKLTDAGEQAMEHAQTYWERYLRNKQVLHKKQPELFDA